MHAARLLFGARGYAAVGTTELDWYITVLPTPTGFELVEADALQVDPATCFPGEAFKLVANIPYHITSPLLHAFLEGERPPELTVLLVQAEVAERIAAASVRASPRVCANCRTPDRTPGCRRRSARSRGSCG